jgi:ketosteroid isomerase-like protein
VKAEAMSTPNAVLAADPKTVVMNFWQALSECRFDDMKPYVGENMVWQLMGCDFMPHQGVFDGRAAIYELLDLAGVLYKPDTFKLDVRAVYVAEPYVVVEFVVDCINHLGRHYADATYCNVFKVVDGLIVEAREYVDSLKVKTVHFDE